MAPGGRAFWAGAFEQDEEFGGLGPPARRVASEDWGLAKIDPRARENTTLAVVAVDAALTPAQARRLAVMAQDGLARAVARGVHAATAWPGAEIAAWRDLAPLPLSD